MVKEFDDEKLSNENSSQIGSKEENQSNSIDNTSCSLFSRKTVLEVRLNKKKKEFLIIQMINVLNSIRKMLMIFINRKITTNTVISVKQIKILKIIRHFVQFKIRKTLILC